MFFVLFQMPVNASSSSSFSLVHPNISSIHADLPLNLYCLIVRPSSTVYFAFFVANILILLPICIHILYLGLQRGQQQQSASTPPMVSHTDTLTYHMVTMELLGVVGYILCCYGIYCDVVILLAGYYIWTFTWFGETFFHILTCMERYLAVVHPITYLSLRRERGIRIRNIGIGCAWVLCTMATCLFTVQSAFINITLFVLIFTSIIISFCSLSVLCTLTRPRPGEKGGPKGRVDQSKLRAFYTLLAILGVVLLRFTWNIVWVAFSVSVVINECLIMMCGVWFNMPCSLVLPSLFLHRAGKVACCKSDAN